MQTEAKKERRALLFYYFLNHESSAEVENFPAAFYF
jgi:hypothetical protein